MLQPLERALHEMHEQLFDDDRAMVRLYGLYLVRETALGAFLDLENGNVTRAQRALREVLKHQYADDVDARWAGTFKTHAAQPDAGTLDADGKPRVREWRDYDPNWRQFMAMILEMTVRLYGHVLGDDLATEMRRAVRRAVLSEPEARISGRYSNIVLMQAWLHEAISEKRATESADSADATAFATPTNRWLKDAATQLQHDGDLAEYNSPTYDAISLLAGCLLLEHSTSSSAQRLGEVVISQVGERLSRVWHPRLGLQAGPYSRAYGVDPRKYICLMSVLMSALEIRAAGPGHLNQNTTHLHDLYFFPLFRRVCGPLRQQLQLAEATTARRHEHTYGSARAVSVVEPTHVIGWESGRRDRFALDQYAPFAYYSTDGFLAVRTRQDTDWVDIEEIGRHVYRITMQRRSDPDVVHETAALTVVASSSPVINDNELLFGEVTLQFPGIVIEVRVAPPTH